MAQGVRGDPPVDLRGFGGGVNGAIQLSRAERVDGIHPGKQPPAVEHAALGTGDAPPEPQAFEQDRREHRVAVLTALALLDAQGHALAVNVADLQRHLTRGNNPEVFPTSSSSSHRRIPQRTKRPPTYRKGSGGSARGSRVQKGSELHSSFDLRTSDARHCPQCMWD